MYSEVNTTLTIDASGFSGPPPMVLRRPSGFIEPCQPSKVARPPSGPRGGEHSVVLRAARPYAGAGLSSDPGAIGKNLQNFRGDLRIRAKHLLSVANAIQRKYCGLIAVGCCLEFVRKDHVGLHSFLSMSLIDARRRNARPRRLRFSQSLARRLHRPSHANVRSTTHRLGKTMKPFA